LSANIGSKFSTKDRDNTGSSSSTPPNGGWWHMDYQNSNLNGNYVHCAQRTRASGIMWTEFPCQRALKSSKMMIRPFDI